MTHTHTALHTGTQWIIAFKNTLQRACKWLLELSSISFCCSLKPHVVFLGGRSQLEGQMHSLLGHSHTSSGINGVCVCVMTSMSCVSIQTCAQVCVFSAKCFLERLSSCFFQVKPQTHIPQQGVFSEEEAMLFFVLLDVCFYRPRDGPKGYHHM